MNEQNICETCGHSEQLLTLAEILLEKMDTDAATNALHAIAEMKADLEYRPAQPQPDAPVQNVIVPLVVGGKIEQPSIEDDMQDVSEMEFDMTFLPENERPQFDAETQADGGSEMGGLRCRVCNRPILRGSVCIGCDIDALRAIPAMWKGRSNPLGDLAKIRSGDDIDDFPSSEWLERATKFIEMVTSLRDPEWAKVCAAFAQNQLTSQAEEVSRLRAVLGEAERSGNDLEFFKSEARDNWENGAKIIQRRDAEIERLRAALGELVEVGKEVLGQWHHWQAHDDDGSIETLGVKFEVAYRQAKAALEEG